MSLSESQLALLELARQARERAHAPYSGFKVGAAVECQDGTVFVGCNVENSSYGLSLCAERIAIFKAISEGRRDLFRIAVIADAYAPVRPCGACRQVISDLLGADAIQPALRPAVRRHPARSESLCRDGLHFSVSAGCVRRCDRLPG